LKVFLLGILSKKEMYDCVFEYCLKNPECPKISEDEKAKCGVENLCAGAIISPLGHSSSRMPEIEDVDNLERAYEKTRIKNRF
jgi:hypothetical protein